MKNNPFNITKAVDLSDKEILNYWVDFTKDSEGTGFFDITKPTSHMPMYILGGKGTGKTHIMRYFSYYVRKEMYGEGILEHIKEEGYLGIYFRCGGLNAARFEGKGQSEETWQVIFQYSIDLWLAQKLLTTIIDMYQFSDELVKHESTIVDKIKLLFDKPEVVNECQTIKDILTTINMLQKQVDYAVNNCVFTGNLNDVEITSSPSKFIFGIPQILESVLPSCKELVFLYLLDEFENFKEPHQKCINSLVREKEIPCSFKIGARLYAFEDLKTLSSKEVLIEGSEYEPLHLDECFRKAKESYEKFTIELIHKRLESEGFLKNNNSNQNSTENLFAQVDDFFEKFPQSKFYDAETAFIAKTPRNKRKYYKDFMSKINTLVGKKNGLKIINILSVAQHPFLDRWNIFLFYKKYRPKKHKTTDDIIKLAKDIANECKLSIKTGSLIEQKQYHFALDILAKLRKESQQPQLYIGLDNYIKMSKGIIRNLLIILKDIFRWSLFNGETPFEDGRISIDAQIRGVQEVSDWFFLDARTTGENASKVRKATARIASLFKDIRYSDKPAECSLVSFSISSGVSPETETILKIAEQWSLFIKIGERSEKNSKESRTKYVLNPMLSPRWELPIYRRGNIDLTPQEVNSIFEKESDAEFEHLKKIRINRMTFKPKINFGDINTPDFFEEE